MKVHQLATRESSSALFCKRPRPLVPKLSVSRSGLNLAENQQPAAPPTTMVEVHSGGTRWNPTREQIGILEMLYGGGMRTPNAHQIESITAQLGKYGKIEGKNVFYWFQNHKARERQRQKRCSVGLSLSTGSPERGSGKPDSGKKSSGSLAGKPPFVDGGGAGRKEEEDKKHEEYSSYNKRKWRSWGDQILDIESRTFGGQKQDKTLELFPLHPEAR